MGGPCWDRGTSDYPLFYRSWHWLIETRHMPAAGWRNDLGFLQTVPKQFSPPSPNGLALWSIRTCCKAGNMSNSLERQWSMNQTVPIQVWSFWSNLGVWSSSLKRQWSMNHTGERNVWRLFALDAERNGKVQRILAAISMCPALNSFSVFSIILWMYVKSDCLRWVKVGSLKVFCLHLQKLGTTARSLAAIESRKKSLRMTWDNKKKHGFWDLLILRVDKKSFTSKLRHLHSQMLQVVLEYVGPYIWPILFVCYLFEPSGSWPYSRPLQPRLWNICHKKPSTLGCSEEVVWIPFLMDSICMAY